MKVAEFLAGHDKVVRVCYPGLPDFEQYDLASSQASGYGAMAWFEVKGGLEAGKTLMDCIDLWSLAENLGSLESLITHPVTMTHADVDEAERKRVGITDGLVRISVGLEDAEDLIAALDAALAQC
jgi:cystathionine beta-lyase/cystathionine gamma-synthase